jgi:hypothetical protein
VFLRIRAGSGGKENLWVGMDAIQMQEESPQQKGHIAAEEASVFMHFVYDDVAQRPEKPSSSVVPVPRLSAAQK